MGDDDLTTWLTAVVERALRGGGVEVTALTRLSAGASRETWAFDAVTPDGRQPLVLQHGGLPDHHLSTGVATQAQVMAAADEHGAPVPRVVASGRDGDREYLITARLDGETLPRRILGDDRLEVARQRLVADCGRALARIHAIPPASVPRVEPRDSLATLRRIADELDEARPAWEFAFRWLDHHRPAARPAGVVHGDFRLGNLLVDADGLAGVLDWELVHVGDPREDLGWLCVRTWRFGGSGRVAGVGGLDDLLAGYVDAGGAAVDPGEVGWWEVLGDLRWAVICVLQARRHTRGERRSVELAAVGRRAYEAEHDLLALIAEVGT